MESSNAGNTPVSEQKRSNAKYSAPALEKGLDILELLATKEGGLTQKEIAHELNRSVSEIFRMLIVLSQRDYLVQDPLTDRYGLTTRLFEVAHRTPLVKRLTALAGPMMHKLAHDLRQSIHLAVVSDDAAMIVGQVDSPDTNVLSVRLGARIDMWKASSGRVILAFTSDDELDRCFKNASLPSGVTESELREELAQIRAVGCEIRDSFVVKGVVNISVPIIDHSGHAIAALTIPFIERYNDEVSFADCREALIAGAEELSVNLGGGISGGIGAASNESPSISSPEPRHN